MLPRDVYDTVFRLATSLDLIDVCPPKTQKATGKNNRYSSLCYHKTICNPPEGNAS